MTGYDRALFGSAWTDNVRVAGGNNGCDTRNDILQRDLGEVAIRPGTRDCLVESGTFEDPFSGETINFVRGRGALVDIDHVVPLAGAWTRGAQSWDEATRRDFANDPINLLAVDAATWLPPSHAFRCDYVTPQIDVKATYGLWITHAEYDAMAKVPTRCP